MVLGDSGVLGWGDRQAGGWCERLRLHWMKMPEAPVVYPLGIRGDGLERVNARWKQEWACRGELRRKVPDGVLLSVGLNDTARVGRADGRQQLVKEKARPFLGICVGMQLLADTGSEGGQTIAGLGWIPGQVRHLADLVSLSEAPQLKIPHMGWLAGSGFSQRIDRPHSSDINQR